MQTILNVVVVIIIIFEIPYVVPPPSDGRVNLAGLGELRQGKVSMSLALFFINHVRPL